MTANYSDSTAALKRIRQVTTHKRECLEINNMNKIISGHKVSNIRTVKWWYIGYFVAE